MQVRVKSRNFLSAPLVSLLLLVGLGLTACGDPSATPVPATTAPAVATTAVATTAASNVATTAANASGSNAQAPASGAGSPVATTGRIPAVPGAKVATVDPAIFNAIVQQMQGLNDLEFKFYISDDDPQKLANSYNTTILAAGYTAAFPLNKQGTSFNAIYNKSGGADLLVSVQPVPADEQQLAKNANLPGVSDTAMKSLLDQVKGHKSIVFAISAPGLLKAAFPDAPTSAAATTAASTTLAATTAANTTASNAGQPVFANVQTVNTGGVISAAVKKQASAIQQVGDSLLVSDDEVEKVVAMVNSAFATAGYKNELGGPLTKSGSNNPYAGIYTKAGADDQIVAVFAVPATAADLSKLLNIPQITQSEYQNMLDGMKGKKSAILQITGPNVYKLLTSSFDNATPTPTK